MSATGRGVDRIEQDHYETPLWCVQRFLEACPIPLGRWYEPCGARGKIIQAANDFYPERLSWFANELREEPWGSLVHLVGEERVNIGDALDWANPPFIDCDEFDAIVTNPPFSKAFEFLEMSLARARFVALLLRVNYTGSEERAEFWRQFPPDLYILPNRPCFHVFISDKYKCPACDHKTTVAEGTPAPHCDQCGTICLFKGKLRTTSDSTEYAWFVYPDGVRERKAGNVVWLAPTPLEVRQAAVAQLLAEQRMAA